MTIELSPPATNAAKPAEAQAAKSKPKAGAPDAKPDSGANGFMAILGALDAAASPGVDAADTATATATAATPSTPAGLDATALLLQNPQIAAALQSATSGTDAVGANTSTVGVNQWKGEDGAASKDAKGVRALRPGASETPGATAPDLAIPQESPAQGQLRAGAHGKGSKESLQSVSDASASTSSAASTNAAAEHKEPVDAKFMAALEQAKTMTATKAAEPALQALNAKPEKSQTERTTGNAKNADPTYSGTAVGVSGPDFSQSAQPAAAMAPEMQVAEQVTYWVSQNVQNAEMKLDGLGQSPVEVSISVQGNEAQIAFRSDEALTRGVLESAGAHLKDMLQREGMVLTGVSVGTSGSGDSGGGDRRGRQGARQTVIAPLQPVAAPTISRTGSTTGRSVDLFV